MPMPISSRRTSYTHADLQRYASCPRSFQLHCIDRLPAETGDSALFAALLRRTCSLALHDHVAARRSGGIELSPVVTAYRAAWLASAFTDPVRFEEGLEVVKSWAVRQGCVDWDDLLGVDEPFEVHIDEYRLVGTLDRVQRVGETVRVRATSAARIPMSRDDAEASLQLAVFDLAARDLWPYAARVEVEVELLRHGSLIRLQRTADQRAATREYIVATIDEIERADAAGESFPVHPSLSCPTCEHRSQCPAYLDALAARRSHVCTSLDDLAAVSREREEVARLVKVLSLRKDALEAILRTRIEADGELQVAGMRYALSPTTQTEYPIGPTLEALARVTDIDEAALLDRLAAIRPPALRKLVDELAPALPADAAAQLRNTLESLAMRTFSLRFTAKEQA